jgi:TorA maturation chaperone TorD
MDNAMPSVNSGRSALPADEIEIARAQEYGLLAVLLAEAPDPDLLDRLAILKGDDSPLGIAHAALAAAAATTPQQKVKREFFDLFIGVGRGELLPYASYYLTGALHGLPLAQLRGDLACFGIARANGCSEPEDHVAILCEIMGGLIDGCFQTSSGADQDIYQKYLAPWIGRFFADLERARAADFYRRVGTLGRQFMAVESDGFKFAA